MKFQFYLENRTAVMILLLWLKCIFFIARNIWIRQCWIKIWLHSELLIEAQHFWVFFHLDNTLFLYHRPDSFISAQCSSDVLTENVLIEFVSAFVIFFSHDSFHSNDVSMQPKYENWLFSLDVFIFFATASESLSVELGLFLHHEFYLLHMNWFVVVL